MYPRLWPKAHRRHWWADRDMWLECWDAMAGTSVGTVALARRDTPRRSQAERPVVGSWADPYGPGRCARCCTWLDVDTTYKWTVQHRHEAEAMSALWLCGECTRAVVAAWRPAGMA